MRPETRRRLDAELARQRWKRIGVAGAIVVLIALAAVFADWRRQLSADDTLVGENHVGGTVTTWHFVGGRQIGPKQVIALRVKLDDGREVDVGTSTHQTAQVGAHVDVLERTYRSGRTTHVWE